jgi:hypothetical protein
MHCASVKGTYDDGARYYDDKMAGAVQHCSWTCMRLGGDPVVSYIIVAGKVLSRLAHGTFQIVHQSAPPEPR